MAHNFLQLHTLTGYSATLLNRDDVGRAKRLPFGGHSRIRVSSQCLKRHWRRATGEWSLSDLGKGSSIRSRRIFSETIADRLREEHRLSDEAILTVLNPIRARILGESVKARTARKGKKREESISREAFVKELSTDQIIVLGRPEVDFIVGLAARLVKDGEGDIKKAVAKEFKEKATRSNLAQVANAGLDACLFGRMVTSDILARCDAAVHVAHSFTVHAEDAEPDYFSALDDILAERGELGSGHINTSELTSGLFYGYVVVDLRKLVSNVSNDAELSAEVVRRLIRLIATVSPGAKLGATAPYACAEFVLAEIGSHQPRTLANAFMKPVRKVSVQAEAVAAIGSYLTRYDQMYGRFEERRVASMIEPIPESAGESVTLSSLADWAGDAVSQVTVDSV